MRSFQFLTFIFLGLLCITPSFSKKQSPDLVEYLPGYGKLPQTTYAGYVLVDKENDGNLFYYFVESQNNPSQDDLVLWLQGGPGCSSLFGAFIENGPQLIYQNGTLYNNPYSWNAKSNLLYIDQPVGTGFSYVTNPFGYVTNEKEIAQELYIGLIQFFTLHPEYSKLKFWVFGESYAGKYIPSFTHYILEQNRQNPSMKINLQGLAMGDGWVAPYYQTGSYAPFLYLNGLIGEASVIAAESSYELYKALIDAGLYVVAADVGNLLLETLALDAGNVDVYDIRYSGGDPTDPLQDTLANYLNQDSVRKQLNVGNHTWDACDPQFGLLNDIDQSVENLLPDLLANYPVLNYNGNYDLICNYLGTMDWTSKIGWPGQDAYNNAKNHTYTVGNQVAGYYKSGGNLTHIVIYNAGHMSPFNQGKNTQDMLYRFINGGFTP